uniref:phage tail tape measure protein n=1 Tax=Pseudomonas sp. S11A4 TaxID=1476791 RepID=UPI0031582409
MATERAKLADQGLASDMAVNGAAGLGVGYAASRPIAKAVGAFAPNEDSATQLKVSMMDNTGKVAEDFQKITDLATKLGDRLPGTTADFQEMMTMLRRQGLSAQSILGGTGEAAAYLGVQLKMPVAEAAEFAAKMQDATRTSEKDMMALMDTIQRGFYSGVDSTNMLRGFSKIAPVMDTIKKSGIEAANELAPLLIMMDQAGMEGGAAGNAFRKIFQAGLNKDKVDDVSKIRQLKGQKIQFSFTNKEGNFAGLENLFAQVEKLKALNDEDRTETIKDLFGDDSETMTTLNTMMNKGLAGYKEVQQKLQNQADLRTRVNEQLSTLTNVMEAAEGASPTPWRSSAPRLPLN